ncbi:MAG TPA: hypothetical protein VMG10_36295 [Gemmataceae bacterium]|nr:hypothetical protein [Gemmataceae bacterium]
MNRRVRAGGILLLTAVCLSAGYQVGSIAITPEPEERDPAFCAEYDQLRYRGLDEVLPHSGVVGYVTDDPDGPEATRSYYLAQYVLAPRILIQGDHSRFVLVDDSPGRPARAAMSGRRLLCDFGNGVRLYAREEPR